MAQLKLKIDSGLYEHLVKPFGGQAKAGGEHVTVTYPEGFDPEPLRAALEHLRGARLEYKAQGQETQWRGWYYDAEDVLRGIERHVKAEAKGKAKAEAAATGALDPDLKLALEKMLKGQNVTMKQVLAVFAAVDVTVVQKSPLVVAVTVGDTTVDVSGYNRAPADYEVAGLKRSYVYGETAEQATVLNAPYTRARRELRERIARALGVVLPEDEEAENARRDEHGLLAPPRPKARKHGDWTCAYCWNVHAVDSHGVLVHHGYRRPGVGYILGDCPGVGQLPWERSPEGAAIRLQATLKLSGETARRLARGYTRLYIKGRDAQGKVVNVPIEPGHPDWVKTEAQARESDEWLLDYLWGGGFSSIPWLRAAIREWKREDTGAVGYPDPQILPEDYEGQGGQPPTPPGVAAPPAVESAASPGGPVVVDAFVAWLQKNPQHDRAAAALCEPQGAEALAELLRGEREERAALMWNTLPVYQGPAPFPGFICGRVWSFLLDTRDGAPMLVSWAGVPGLEAVHLTQVARVALPALREGQKPIVTPYGATEAEAVRAVLLGHYFTDIGGMLTWAPSFREASVPLATLRGALHGGPAFAVRGAAGDRLSANSTSS